MKTKTISFGLVLIAITALMFVGVHSACAQSGTWTTKAPMPEPRVESAAAVVDGRMYVVGGSNRNSEHSTTPEIYDSITDAWSFGSPASIARGQMAIGALNDKVYVAGGWVNNDANAGTRALEIYDPATDSWANGAPMAVARGETASAVIGGKLYVTGGHAPFGNLFSNLEIYNPLTDTWSMGAPLPTKVAAASGAALNGKLYVVGGHNGHLATGALQIYDPVSDTWTTGAPMPTPRSGQVAGVIDGKLIVVSGDDGTTFVPNVEIYDPVSNSWTTGTPLPQPRYLMVAGVIGSQMFVTGGYALSGETSGALQVYTPGFSFAGFLAPIGGADATGGSFTIPLRTFKMGSTIPVKFTASSGGSPVLTGVHTLQAIKYSDSTSAGTPIDATPQEAATTGNQFRLVDSQWHFNLDTKGTGMSTGIWLLRATLSDGSEHSVWIQLK